MRRKKGSAACGGWPFQSTHRTQTMRLIFARFLHDFCTFQSTHRTQTMRHKAGQPACTLQQISIHASYANDATKGTIEYSKFQHISIHASYANDATANKKQNIGYSFLFKNSINSINLTCDISLNLA